MDSKQQRSVPGFRFGRFGLVYVVCTVTAIGCVQPESGTGGTPALGSAWQAVTDPDGGEDSFEQLPDSGVEDSFELRPDGRVEDFFELPPDSGVEVPSEPPFEFDWCMGADSNGNGVCDWADDCDPALCAFVEPRPAAPVLTALNEGMDGPARVPWYGNSDGSATLYLTGTSFVTEEAAGANPNLVTFEKAGIQVRSSTFVLSATEAWATVPPFDARWGTFDEKTREIAVDVTLTTGGATTNALRLVYYKTTPPTIISLSPSSGRLAGGSVVEITGTGFEDRYGRLTVRAVFFGEARLFTAGPTLNGAKAYPVIVVHSATSMTVVVPPFQGGEITPGDGKDPIVDVRVLSGDGVASEIVKSDQFTYTGTVWGNSVCQYGHDVAKGQAVICSDYINYFDCTQNRCVWSPNAPNYDSSCIDAFQTECSVTVPGARIVPAGQQFSFSPDQPRLAYYWSGHGNESLSRSQGEDVWTVFNAGDLIAMAVSLAKEHRNTPEILVQSFGCCTFKDLSRVRAAVNERLVPVLRENASGQTVTLIGYRGFSWGGAYSAADTTSDNVYQFVVKQDGIFTEAPGPIAQSYQLCGHSCQADGTWRYAGECPEHSCTDSPTLPTMCSPNTYSPGSCP